MTDIAEVKARLAEQAKRGKNLDGFEYAWLRTDDVSSLLADHSRLEARDAEWESPLHDLRRQGWRVAVHNDYRQGGEDRTFWLFTHADGRWVKGEGVSDFDALTKARAALTPANTEGER